MLGMTIWQPQCGGVASALPAGSSRTARMEVDGWHGAHAHQTPRPRPGRRIRPPAATEPRTWRGSMRSSLAAVLAPGPAGRCHQSYVCRLPFAFPNGLSPRQGHVLSPLPHQDRSYKWCSVWSIHFSCCCCASVKKEDRTQLYDD